MFNKIYRLYFLMGVICSCSQSTTKHDGSFFGGDSNVSEDSQRVIDQGLTSCEIKNNQLLTNGCVEYSGVALKRLAFDCKDLAGTLKKDCASYNGKSRCVGVFGGLGGIVAYGATSEECDRIKVDPIIPSGAEVSFQP